MHKVRFPFDGCPGHRTWGKSSNAADGHQRAGSASTAGNVPAEPVTDWATGKGMHFIGRKGWDRASLHAAEIIRAVPVGAQSEADFAVNGEGVYALVLTVACEATQRALLGDPSHQDPATI